MSEEHKKPITPEEAEEVGPLYGAGALDHVSARAFERRLEASDDEVVREISAWKATAAELPLVLDPVAPDPRVKADLLARIASERNRSTASRSATTVPAQSTAAAGRRWLYLLPLAAALVLAVASVFLYRRTLSLENEVSKLALDVRTKEQELVAQKTEFDQLLARSGQMVSLAGGDGSPQASAKLFWDKKRQTWIIFFFNLPAAPPDRQYQFWYITKDQRKVSAAVLKSADLSQGKLTLELPADIASNVAAAGLTLEPAGGSPQPTGQLYIVGSV